MANNNQIPEFETEAATYPSLGKCIFCFRSPPEVALTDEHIIPLFLSATGERIIRNGSCEDCNRFANERYEQTASNHDFLVPRLLLELKRRKKKKIKALPPVALGTAQMDLTPEQYDTVLAREQYPAEIHLPAYERAGLLAGVVRGGSISTLGVQRVRLTSFVPANAWSMRTPLHSTAPGLTVAKIAYCHAVATLGLEAFDGDEIRSLLSCQRSDTFDFVGTAARSDVNVSKRFLHRLSLREESGFLVCRVGLFASLGVKPYEVVVGKSAS